MTKILILAALLTTPSFTREQAPKSQSPQAPVMSAQPAEAKSELTDTKNGVCRVTAFLIDHSIPHSAIFGDPTFVGEFELKFKGTMIVERLPHKESGIDIIASVTRMKSTVLSKRPMVIRFTIQLVAPGPSYNFYGGATESIYDKNWSGTVLSSHFRVGERSGYTFTVACEKRKK
jgi:hypothetical protein